MRRTAVGLAASAAAALAVARAADGAFPPDLSRLTPSRVVLDRDGAILRVFQTADGKWRLPVDPGEVSRNYLDALVATEDARFRLHPGVDPLAVARATWQLATRGHVVSGASTLAMQVARLLEPRPRTFASKVVEALRAVQIEARLGREGVLRAYATLAPMGGNVEGVRAGSLTWFGKEPTALSDAEAATLVALPRSPARLRPDRHPERATTVRDAVLRRLLPSLADARAAAASALPTTMHRMPSLAFKEAAHVASVAPGLVTVRTTLDARLQARLEALLRRVQDGLPSPVAAAALVADWRTGEVLARADGSDLSNPSGATWVDLTRAVRSPGSTLKPFVYGMAFDRLLAHPDSVVADEPTRYDDYAPHDFDGRFTGDVTVRRALQASLNLPAVLVLRRLGPVAFAERFREAGMDITFPKGDEAPGLPVVLGGVGTTLETLASGYAALAGGGQVRPLVERPGPARATEGVALMRRPASDAVVDILAGVVPPPGSPPKVGRVAYKTGTSFGFRDGWAVGFDEERVVAVWMGRPDGASCDQCMGARSAGVLFEAFDLMSPRPLRPRALDGAFAGPPPSQLARLDGKTRPSDAGAPRIDYPVRGARILVDGDDPHVGLSASGGAAPYVWLADGRRVGGIGRSHDMTWRPDGEGFVTLTVVDATGLSDVVRVRVERRPDDRER